MSGSPFVQNGKIIGFMSSALKGAEQYALCNIAAEALYAGMISEEDYHILRRIGIEGASISEVAAELGVSLPTVRKRIQRAKNRFRKQYERQIGMVKRKNKKN